MIRKDMPLSVVAIGDGLSDRQIRVRASSGVVDRAGDILVPKGCFLRKKVFPVLADHDAKIHSLVGSAAITISETEVDGLITFLDKGISALADEVCAKYKAGVATDVSVGFDPIEFEPIGKTGGFKYLQWELLELSCVVVACNFEAVTIARSLPSKTKADSEWKVGASRNLTIDEDSSWDGPDAEASIFAHCGFDGDKPDTNFARKGFLVYDASAPALKGSYKLPFAKVKDGRLVALKSGIRAAASRPPQTDIPDAAAKKARAVIDHYEAKFSDDGKGASAMKIKSATIVTKGMYGCAQLASMLEDLGWAVMSSAWEAEMEGDGSKVPAMLAEGLRVLADAFVAMSQEEVAELLANVSPDGDKAARAKVLKSLLPKAQKAGRRFSQANQAHLDAIDKCTKAMDACREKMADLHDEAGGHTEELKGHIDEMKGHLKAMTGSKAADNTDHLDEMSKCTDKMETCCAKAAHLHDYLHDHMEELQQHIEETGEHVKAMQGDDDGKKKPDADETDDDDDGNDDGELAADVDGRKRVLELLAKA